MSGVQLFQHKDYTGKTQTFSNLGRYDIDALKVSGGIGNDAVSAIKFLSPGLCLRGYQDSGFRGASHDWCEDAADLSDVKWGDKISSFEIMAKPGAIASAASTPTSTPTPLPPAQTSPAQSASPSTSSPPPASSPPAGDASSASTSSSVVWMVVILFILLAVVGALVYAVQRKKAAKISPPSV